MHDLFPLIRRPARRLGLLSGAVLGALLAGGAPAYANIVIDPFFEPSITGDPNASTIEGTIDSAIAFYEANISTPITVNIAFEEGGGLGASSTYIGTVPYLTYITDLHAASSGDATDTTALAGLPITATNPVNGGTTITAKLANLNAVGIATPGAFPDLCPGGTGSGNFNACITLNTGITFPPQPNNGSNFSLLSVTEHEIDEVLGLGSGLSCSAPGAANCTVGTPNPEDLFRYTAGGTRSYSLNPQTSDACTGAPAAEFSLNGTTDLKQFNNCDNGGDYGDWADNGSPAAVQDAFG